MGDVEKMREVENEKMETEMEEIGGTETSEIDKLTEDCLMEIFQRLSIADKIRIERVSKKWRSLSQRSWNNFKSLDYSVKTWGIKEHPYRQQIIKRINFDKIIRLSGIYLTSICTNTGNFGKICHLLPNIQKLQLLDDCPRKDACPAYNNKLDLLCTYSHDAWKRLFSWLMSYGKNITNFKIELSHLHYEGEDFARVFRKMKQLKTFQLGNADCLDWSETFILELPLETIQEIILRANYRTAFDDKLPMIIKKCKQLETFCTSGAVISKKVGLLKTLTSQAASLKNLGIHHF
ncbi:uncharacterized protein LOC117173176 [Belonocnema kinseyi]|uniref:uncharacterized protein LOC117173176 n=1 Tax=Belonocnema kinseyi TaxID=2817044 RepID=UPI00143D775C|nr:uncharacterized protein LOC117173176 [Belonocnema kinseyi]